MCCVGEVPGPSQVANQADGTVTSRQAAKLVTWRSALRYLLGFLVILVVIGAALIVFTDLTHFTASQVRLWVAATAPAISGLAALAAASIAVVSLIGQQRLSRDSLQAQAQASSDAFEQRRRMAHEDRIWDRRIELYKAILVTVRDPQAGRGRPDGDYDDGEIAEIVSSWANAQRPELADLEPDVLAFASQSVIDVYNKHLSECSYVQETGAYGNQLSGKDTDDFFTSLHRLQMMIRAELQPETTAQTTSSPS